MATPLPAETGCYFSLERPGDTLKKLRSKVPSFPGLFWEKWRSSGRRGRRRGLEPFFTEIGYSPSQPSVRGEANGKMVSHIMLGCD